MSFQPGDHLRVFPAYSMPGAARYLNLRVVVTNPDVTFGRPVIAGTGIPVSSIYERYKAGDSA